MPITKRKGRASTLAKTLLAAGLCASKQRFRMPKILAIAALMGVAALSPPASMALTISPEVKLKLERTNPPDAIPFTDEFELYITYDLDSFGSTSGLTPAPRSVLEQPLDQPVPVGGLGRPYTFQGYNILSVKGTYTNPPSLGGETYIVPLQGPAPVGSSVTNIPSSGSAGTNDKPPVPGDPDLRTPTTWSAFWPLGEQGNTSNKFPPDLTAHGESDNLYNPDGGFTLGDLGFPAERDNGLLSYGGLLFFVDYGTDYAAEGYPYQYLPYQVFFKSLLANDPAGEDYGGCPGDCGNVKLTVQTPAPLPLLGVGAALGFSRNLRKRIKTSKLPKVVSALG